MMRPYNLERWEDAPNSNRKIALCPLCGREELIGIDSELVKCSICCQTRQDDKPAVRGEDIKALREKMGVSLKSLADDLKISKGQLSKIEAGKHPVNSTLTTWFKDAQKGGLKGEGDKDIQTP